MAAHATLIGFAGIALLLAPFGFMPFVLLEGVWALVTAGALVRTLARRPA
jgi:hypothetical protein